MVKQLKETCKCGEKIQETIVRYDGEDWLIRECLNGCHYEEWPLHCVL